MREEREVRYKYILAFYIYNFDPYEILQNVKLAWNASLLLHANIMSQDELRLNVKEFQLFLILINI